MPATESGLMNLKNDSPTIGIVGSNGFLGSALIEQSQKSGLNVVSIGRTAPEMNITHLYMDFTQPDGINLHAIQNLDVLVYCIKLNNCPLGCFNDLTEEKNLKTLISALNSLSVKLVYVSTGSVYPMLDRPSLESDAIPHNRGKNDYLMNKIQREILIENESQDFTIVRLFYPFGKKMNPQRLVPKLVRKIYAKERITIPVEDLYFNPIHRLDAAKAILHITSRNLKKVNIAGDEIISLRVLIQDLTQLTGFKAIVRSGPIQISSANLGSIELLLSTSFKFTYDYYEALREYLDNEKK